MSAVSGLERARKLVFKHGICEVCRRDTGMPEGRAHGKIHDDGGPAVPCFVPALLSLVEELERDTLPTLFVSKALVLVETSLQGSIPAQTVREQTGGNAPELVQGILDSIGVLHDRAAELEHEKDIAEIRAAQSWGGRVGGLRSRITFLEEKCAEMERERERDEAMRKETAYEALWFTEAAAQLKSEIRIAELEAAQAQQADAIEGAITILDTLTFPDREWTVDQLRKALPAPPQGGEA